MEPMIPGTRDETTTLTHRQPGAMGGDPHGADIPGETPQWDDEPGRKEHKRDGGGAPRERRRDSGGEKIQD